MNGNSYEMDVLLEMFDSINFTETTNPETGVKAVEGACGFTAVKFAGKDETTPNWVTNSNGKEYCFVLGYAKQSSFNDLCYDEKGQQKLQLALLNKKTYDTGEFELDKHFSSILSFDIETEDGEIIPNFADNPRFVVFENIKIDASGKSDIDRMYQAFLAKKAK
tara:strand:+ start:576 stop:1067 length:492 start_codon:yes stop_codon:yes gene_type:complete